MADSLQHLVDDARHALASNPMTISPDSADSWPKSPGLYSVDGEPEVWRSLGLGEPPDARPLYIGKAEKSLSSRDIGTHFGYVGPRRSSVTGSSTLRRSLAALLRTSYGFRGQYRNPQNPSKPANYGLSPEHDASLSDWMRANLRVCYWVVPPATDLPLAVIEKRVFQEVKPPLNLKDVETPWRVKVMTARSVMSGDLDRPAGN